MNQEEKMLEHDSTEGVSQSRKESLFTIPVIHEEVRITTEVVETGKVKISKKVSEHQEHVNIPLTYDEVEVERVPINQFVEHPPEAVRYEGDTMIIPILEEVIVKRILLVEEVRVTKRQMEKSENQEVTLRKEEVTIEREHKQITE